MHEANPVFPVYDEENELLRELGKRRSLGQTVAMLRTRHDLVADRLELLPEDGWRCFRNHSDSGVLTIEFSA